MAESIITFNVADMEPVKSLLDVLVANMHKLPSEVLNAMQMLAGDIDSYAYNLEYLHSRGIDHGDVKVFINGVITEKVIAGYPISKVVSTHGVADAIVSSFWIYAPCGSICGWGEKPDIACGGEIKGKLKVPANEC
jgi:hypothetical protein